MIDISSYSTLPALTGVLSSYITGSLFSTNFQISQYPKREYWMLMDKTEDIFDPNVTTYSFDGLAYLTSYAKGLLNIEFSSILVAGLGIGTLPYIIKNHSSCSVIDVIENNQEIIDLVISVGYLNDVNIINSDIFTFTPTTTYDIILLDIWMCDCNNFTTERDTLITKYLPSLNPGGFIYIPINMDNGGLTSGSVKFQN
jgi:hypothetical protein